MLYSVYLIEDSCTRLKTLSTAIEKNLKTPEKFDAGDVLPKLSNAINDTLTGLSELQFGCDDTRYNMLFQLVKNAAGLIEKPENISLDLLHNQVTQVINFVESSVNKDMYEGDYSWYYSRHFNPNRSKPNPYPNSLFYKIASTLVPCDRNINVLTMRDVDGEQSYNMRECFGSVKATYYGVGLPDSIASYVRDRFDRVALGAMRGGSITNAVFDFLVCSPIPKLNFDIDKAVAEKTAVLDDVRDSFKYLRLGGFLIMGLPYFRFSREVCAYLARTFEDIQVLRPSMLDKETGYVYFIGRKRDRTKDTAASNDVSGNESFYLMRKLSHDADAATLLDDMRPFALPVNEVPIPNFTGSILDTREQLQIIERSSASQSFWNDMKEQPHNDEDKHPPLPLGFGQIGLVTCSGCMNGVINEGNGCCHLVKGRVVKYTEINSTEDKDVTKISKIESNRVEINILTPDGEHKKLA